MNPQATLVKGRGLYRSAISIRLIHLREIDRAAFWECCNTICQERTFERISLPLFLPGSGQVRRRTGRDDNILTARSANLYAVGRLKACFPGERVPSFWTLVHIGGCSLPGLKTASIYCAVYAWPT
jgi:hypothetical protein